MNTFYTYCISNLMCNGFLSTFIRTEPSSTVLYFHISSTSVFDNRTLKQTPAWSIAITHTQSIRVYVHTYVRARAHARACVCDVWCVWCVWCVCARGEEDVIFILFVRWNQSLRLKISTKTERNIRRKKDSLGAPAFPFSIREPARLFARLLASQFRSRYQKSYMDRPFKS